jgi:hypothetical protein
MAINPYFLSLTENPRLAAGEVLRDARLQDDAPVDLEKLCRRHDWSLSFKEFGDGRDAYVQIDSDGRVSIFVNTDESSEKDNFSLDSVTRARQRFSMAHEIGHATMHTHKDKALQDALSVEKNLHGKRYGFQREAQADEFGSELLIPQSQLIQLLRGFKWDAFFTGAEEVASLYEVSLMAAAIRLAKETPFPAMLINFDSGGKAYQVPARSKDHADTGFFFSHGERVPQGTLADELLNKADCTTRRRRQQDCTKWFSSKKARSYSLDEQVKRLGRFGLMTFLGFEERETEY